MKKLISRIIMMIAIAISFSTAADAQVVVKIRPPQPVINVRPPAPSPGHVWISGEWRWDNSNRRYDYKEGYWDRPGRGHHGWVEGHWRHTRRGWIWVPGHWR